MEIRNTVKEVTIKKKTKEFVLTKEEMRAILLFIGPANTSEMVEMIGRSKYKKKSDNAIELTNTINNIYGEAYKSIFL